MRVLQTCAAQWTHPKFCRHRPTELELASWESGHCFGRLVFLVVLSLGIYIGAFCANHVPNERRIVHRPPIFAGMSVLLAGNKSLLLTWSDGVDPPVLLVHRHSNDSHGHKDLAMMRNILAEGTCHICQGICSNRAAVLLDLVPNVLELKVLVDLGNCNVDYTQAVIVVSWICKCVR